VYLIEAARKLNEFVFPLILLRIKNLKADSVGMLTVSTFSFYSAEFHPSLLKSLLNK